MDRHLPSSVFLHAISMTRLHIKALMSSSLVRRLIVVLRIVQVQSLVLKQSVAAITFPTMANVHI
jgi:hypothetical protein